MGFISKATYKQVPYLALAYPSRTEVQTEQVCDQGEGRRMEMRHARMPVGEYESIVAGLWRRVGWSRSDEVEREERGCARPAQALSLHLKLPQKGFRMQYH